MGNTLFKGWTDNQLMAVFALANAEIAARKNRKKKEQTWRHVARMTNLAAKPKPR